MMQQLPSVRHSIDSAKQNEHKLQKQREKQNMDTKVTKRATLHARKTKPKIQNMNIYSE